MKVIDDDLWFCPDCARYAETRETSFDLSESEIKDIEDGLTALCQHDMTVHMSDEEHEFSRAQCDCCGTSLAGTRYRFALLGPETDDD